MLKLGFVINKSALYWIRTKKNDFKSLTVFAVTKELVKTDTHVM